MRYHTKEYYTLLMTMGTVDGYEPVVDKEYTEEEIEELYQQALDRYIEEERADYDEPPVIIIDDDDDDDDDLDIEELLEEYENRPPFDEEEAAEEFEEMYNDNLEEPDEDLPEWVRETVDPRILAMYCIPEKIFRQLAEEDEVNEARFDELDKLADAALEDLRESLPEEYVDFTDVLEDIEDAAVIDVKKETGSIELTVLGWDDEGEDEIRLLSFAGVDIIEDEGIEAHSWEDEDGELESDCELLYSEVYREDGKPEIHMLLGNDGLKYLTFRCAEAHACRVRRARRKELAVID